MKERKGSPLSRRSATCERKGTKLSGLEVRTTRDEHNGVCRVVKDRFLLPLWEKHDQDKFFRKKEPRENDRKGRNAGNRYSLRGFSTSSHRPALKSKSDKYLISERRMKE